MKVIPDDLDEKGTRKLGNHWNGFLEFLIVMVFNTESFGTLWRGLCIMQKYKKTHDLSGALCIYDKRDLIVSLKACTKHVRRFSGSYRRSTRTLLQKLHMLMSGVRTFNLLEPLRMTPSLKRDFGICL